MSPRLKKINELLKRELSTLFPKEFEFQPALVTIMDVDTTQDLKEAKVWLSILGSDNDYDILEIIQKKRGSIQKKLMKRVVLRQTPILDFRIDRSMEQGCQVLSALDEVDKITPPENQDKP
mgnify:FL=1